MAQIAGVDASVLLYQETTFGTDPDPASGIQAYFSTLGMKASQAQIESPILASGRGVTRPARGNIDAGGSFNTTLAPGTCTFWLDQLFGAHTGSGTNASPAVWVPKALPAGFVVEVDWTSKIASKVERYNGCRVKSAKIDLPQSGHLPMALDIAAKRYSIATAVLDATPTDGGHESWVGYDGIVKRGGTQIGGVMNASINIDNDMDTGIYTYPASGETAGERNSLPEGYAKISGNVEMVFEDFTMIDLAYAGTETTIEWVYTNSGGDVLSILLDHVDIPLQTPSIETRSGLKVNLNWMAFASGSDMGIVVTYTPAA